MASDLDLELRDLQQYFASRLPERLEEIELTWNEVRGSWAPDAMRELHRLAHSLTGAGGTFGFPEVTRTARALERYLKEHLEPSGPPADRGPETEVHVEALLEDLRTASRTPPPDPAPSLLALDPVPRRPEERLVFLIEDDPDVGAALDKQLQHYGYGVRLLPDPARLAAELERQRPDVLIVDMVFPQGDLAGVQAVAEARRAWSGAWPKVVFLSSRNDLEARLEAVRAGGDAYFTKPVDLAPLVEKLDALTERHAHSPYRVLIVANDADLAGDYGGALESAGMRAEVVFDPLQTLDTLYGFQPDLILMDIYMKACTGPELAAVLRQQESYLTTPIVYLSTEEGLTEQLAAIERGGDDFLPRFIELHQLVSAVEARARRGRMLQSLISHDGLTGLLNHGNLKLSLEAEISRASRDGSTMSYAMIDLDRFKSINDNYGHPAGDRLLRSLALFLRQRLRRSDVLARYGGDELAVILPRTDGATAVQVLDEIREGFSLLRHRVGVHNFTATLSCGVATYPARPTSELLTEAADAALYSAKRAGRNRVELAV
ncbi:MAG: diguanylate cyclase [Acidobacteriota bacterium]